MIVRVRSSNFVSNDGTYSGFSEVTKQHGEQKKTMEDTKADHQRKHLRIQRTKVHDIENTQYNAYGKPEKIQTWRAATKNPEP